MKPEDKYWDGICPGILYSVGDSPPQRYTDVGCYQGGICRVSCILYEGEGKCSYKQSLKGDTYRQIDDLIFSGSGEHPLLEQSPEKEALVDGELQREDLLASQNDTLLSSSPPNHIILVANNIKDIEDFIDEGIFDSHLPKKGMTRGNENESKPKC